MKKLMKIISLSFIVIFLTGNAVTYAQSSYNHSIGVTVGTFYGPTYKTFLMEKMALQVDLGVKLNTILDWPGVAWDLELNPNLAYQSNIGNSGLLWFAGGGLSLGYAFVETYKSYSDYFNAGKFGVNAIIGMEYIFSSVPLSLQLDFRPGYGLIFYNEILDPSDIWWAEILGMTDKDYKYKIRDHYFDWTIGLSLRYTF